VIVSHVDGDDAYVVGVGVAVECTDCVDAVVDGVAAADSVAVVVVVAVAVDVDDVVVESCQTLVVADNYLMECCCYWYSIVVPTECYLYYLLVHLSLA